MWISGLLFAFFITNSSAVRIARLPEAVVPLRYEVTLLPVIEENARLCGHVSIELAVKKPTYEVVLHAFNLKILRIVLRKMQNDSIQTTVTDPVEDTCFVSGINEENLFSPDQNDLVDSFFLDDQSEQMIVKSKEMLDPDMSYSLGILYLGNIQEDDNRGFFRIKYSRDEDDAERWIGVTQLEATQARRVFPCFDEPRFKASFHLMVGHARRYKALSNMPLLSLLEFKTTDKWVWSSFSETPPMATYLVACVITELDYTETIHQSISGRNVTIRLWSHGHRLDQLEFPKRLVPMVLGRLERHIRVPYALPKLDIVAIPNHESLRAMENWGLILFSESTLILTESGEGNPAMHKAIMSGTMVHELAHQWFGNLVTWYWWDNVWLNEGLATFFENVILNEIAPEVNADMAFTLYYAQCLENDKIGTSVALNTPAELFPMIENKFDGLAYIKGGALFRMVRNFVGQDAFQTAIYRYVSKFQFKNANSTDMWALMNQEARRYKSISERMNVARIMNSWTQQTGFPLVTVARTSNGSIRINQSGFYGGSHALNEDITSRFWWIPISIVTAEQRSFALKDLRPVAWLTPKKPSIEIEAPRSNFSWIVVNPELTGYYRVNYDDWLWRLISQQLMRDHNAIPPLTRAQLIDDAFTLGHAQMIPYETALHLIEYMAYVDEVRYVRNAASVHVNRLLDDLSVNGGALDTPSWKFGSIVRRMYSIITDSEISRPRSRSPSSLQHLFEDGPCQINDEYCVAEALRLFRGTMNGTSLSSRDSEEVAAAGLTRESDTRFLSDYTESVWCTAIRHGGQAEWDYAWNRSSADSTSVLEQKLMIRAMACSRDAQHINQLLSRMFHPALGQKPAETALILKHLSQNSPIRPVVVKFVFRNLNFILRHLRKPSHFLEAMNSVIKRLDNEEEKRQFKVLVLERASELGAFNAKVLLSALE